MRAPQAATALLSLAWCLSCSTPRAQDDATTRRDASRWPRFERMLALETTADTSANVSIGDVNGDGNPDLVLAKGRHWPLVNRVLLGDGHGRIALAHDLGPIADRTYSGLLVDLDRDGDLDVVISNDAPDPKRVYLNDGSGRFHEGSTFGRPQWETRHVSVADLDGDGWPDIIVANRPTIVDGRPTGDAANYICSNRRAGRFDDRCQAFSHEPATTIAAADFNGDGLIDLAVPYRDRGQSVVYINGGHGVFDPSRRLPFGPPDATIRVAAAADMNADGVLDLVSVDENRGVVVYFGRGDGSFADALTVAGGTPMPYALAVDDLNGDGKPDIVVGHVEAPSTVYFNDGAGRRYAPVQFGDVKGTVYGFAIGDVDRDGRADIAVARSDAPNVLFFGDEGR
jgi:hypothetical protein